MNTGACRCGCGHGRPTAAEANEAIRAFVAGRIVWSPADLLELDRLRRAWAEAQRRELDTAA